MSLTQLENVAGIKLTTSKYSEQLLIYNSKFIVLFSSICYINVLQNVPIILESGLDSKNSVCKQYFEQAVCCF